MDEKSKGKTRWLSGQKQKEEEDVNEHFPEDPGLSPNETGPDSYRVDPGQDQQPPSAKASADEPATTNLKTEDMEVHHTHSHGPGSHGVKNWKSYFWEFLMLFLAVFCGFLAEYKLEHVIEHQREKQYMQSFIHDLISDIASLNEGFPRKEQRIVAIDSVFLFFEINPGATRIPGSVYRQMNRTVWDRHYRRNSTTIDQLKNAGGMRLIRNRTVADSIAAYDLQWQKAEFYREAYITNQEKGKAFTEKIFNAYDLVAKYRRQPAGNIFPASITDTLTVRINSSSLNEFLNHLGSQRNLTAQDKKIYQAIERSAERLIESIKKEYHLE